MNTEAVVSLLLIGAIASAPFWVWIGVKIGDMTAHLNPDGWED